MARIPIILNPASGPERPVLRIFNTAFAAAQMDWEVFITKRAGEAYTFAQQLKEVGAPLVAVYGGDGTLKEVARALAGSEVVLGLLPGGTGNALAVELGVPRALPQALALLCDPTAQQVRAMDLGQIHAPGSHLFILRASMGLETEVLQSTGRTLKNQLGQLAYPLTLLQRLSAVPFTRYHLTVDGQTFTAEGIQCTLANSAQMGVGGLALAQGVDMADGLLDVIVLKQIDWAVLAELATSNFTRADLGLEIQHWRGRSVTAVAEPPQAVAIGGDMIGVSPVQASVLPGALRVVMPR